MRRVLCSVCLVLVVSIAASAQVKKEFPRIEVFAGYSRLIGDQQGFNGSIAGNINGWFGVVGDLSSLSSKMTEGSITEKISGNIYLVGPQFSYRAKRVTPFVRGLLGAATAKSKLTVGNQSFEVSDTNFSYGVGGGLDIRVSKHVAVRAIQADYIHTSAFGEGQHNGRLSFGVVLGF